MTYIEKYEDIANELIDYTNDVIRLVIPGDETRRAMVESVLTSRLRDLKDFLEQAESDARSRGKADFRWPVRPQQKPPVNVVGAIGYDGAVWMEGNTYRALDRTTGRKIAITEEEAIRQINQELERERHAKH